MQTETRKFCLLSFVGTNRSFGDYLQVMRGLVSEEVVRWS